MITFDTNKARFLSNLRICDAIPGIATITNITHLIFKTSALFKGPEVEPSLYSKFVSQGSTLEFIIRAIPVVGQIFNAAQHLYYERKILKQVSCPPLHVMTSELGHTYIHAAIKNNRMGDFVKNFLEFLTPKKFEMILDVLIENKNFKELYYLLKKCDPSFNTEAISRKIPRKEINQWHLEDKRKRIAQRSAEHARQVFESVIASDPSLSDSYDKILTESVPNYSNFPDY